jgi:hypothetical protein
MKVSRLVPRNDLELIFYVVCGLASLMLISVLWTGLQARQVEIAAEGYAMLNEVANHSCSGREHLKQIVLHGPILGKEYNAVFDELQKRKVAAETMLAKRAVTQQPAQECA